MREREEAKEIREGAEDEDQNAIEGKKAFNSVVIAKLLHVLSVDYYFMESASRLQCCWMSFLWAGEILFNNLFYGFLINIFNLNTTFNYHSALLKKVKLQNISNMHRNLYN